MKAGHHRLEVWTNGVELVRLVYELTSKFPDHERFGLSAQLRRSAVSIPSNIAEGAARSSPAELLRYLYIARGSLMELETQLAIARVIGHANPCDAEAVAKALEREFALLSGFITALRKRCR